MPGLFIGIVALGLAAWLGLGTPEMRSHFFHSYLTAYSFFLAITLGSIIFVIIQHLARAGWSVTVRRLAERLGLNMFLMAILLPAQLLAGMKAICSHWMYDGEGTGEQLENTGYLNPTFFGIRIVAYFVIWCFVAWFFASRSTRQDESGGTKITRAETGVAQRAGHSAVRLFADRVCV